MYAIRCKTGHVNGFRVGDAVYSNSAWKLQESVTPEHEFAADHGALVILEVDGPQDPALAPFGVEKGVETLIPTVSGSVGMLELHGQLRLRDAEIADLQLQLAHNDAEMADLHTQLLAVEGENQRANAQIAELRQRLDGVETAVAGVAAEVAHFPAEASSIEADTPAADPASSSIAAGTSDEQPAA